MIVSLFITHITFSQSLTITGKVVDAGSGEPLVGATVLFVNIRDSAASRFGNTGVDGIFLVKELSRAFYKVRIRSVGYKPYQQIVRVSQTVSLGAISLQPDIQQLQEVVVEGDLAVVQKGDTMVFRAGAFKTNPDATAADLVSKMPGMIITDSGVESNGEAINQVLLDGRRFFGQDPLLALNTLPAEIVNEVEVFDQQSERARMTGFDDGSTTKTMNLVTKEDKRQGEFGKFTAGQGTNERYTFEGSLNSFKKERQLTLLGMSNNLNKTEFSSSDITGSGQGQRGGSQFLRGAQQTPTGITGTNTTGFNYNNSVKGKWQLESSYFFERSDLENSSMIQGEEFRDKEASQYYEKLNTRNSLDRNHKFDLRGEYKIDEHNSLLFIPSLTLDGGEASDFLNESTTYLGEQLNEVVNDFLSENAGYDTKNNLIYSHKFNGRTGRTFVLDMRFNENRSDGDDVLDDLVADSSTFYQNRNIQSTWTIEPGFTEPVGASSQVQVSYELSKEDRSSDLDTYESTSDGVNNPVFIDPLSGYFESIATHHSPTIGFSKRSFSNFFSFQLSFKHTTLENRATDREMTLKSNTFNVLLPSFMGRIPVSDRVEIFMRYSTQTALPSTRQLQEVIDNRDRLSFSIGNMDLDQSYTHQLMMRVGETNTEKNTSITNFTMVRKTNDHISTNSYITLRDSLLAEGVRLPAGAQVTSPINVNGYWNVRNNTTYSFVLARFKLNVNANVGFSYVRNPGVVNLTDNVSETFNLNSKITFASNISKEIDFNVFYQWNTNSVENSIQSGSSSRYLTHTIGGKLNLMLPGGIIFRSDWNYQYYDGISGSFDTVFTLWNASLAKKFLKNSAGEVTITAFDLLHQNQSITQEVTAAYIEENQSLVLQQYFMVSMTYTLRNFGG